MPVIKPAPINNQETLVIRELPSKFKPYSIDKIEMRSLNFGEMKYLSTDDLDNEQIISIFKSAILNINVDDFSWADFLFISTHMSLFTMDDQIWTISSYCKSCKSPILKKLNREVFFEFEELNIPAYPLNIKVKDKDLVLGVITVKNHLDFSNMSKDIDPAILSIFSLSFMVKNMPQEEAYKFLLSITNPDDIALFDKVDSLLYHSVKPIEIVCEKCKYVGDYKVGLEVSTITPFRENEKSLMDRISFGNPTKPK